jgi:hypothetical protein
VAAFPIRATISTADTIKTLRPILFTFILLFDIWEPLFYLVWHHIAARLLPCFDYRIKYKGQILTNPYGH